MKMLLLSLPLLLLLAARGAGAEPLSPTPPADPKANGPWREAWYAYGRDIRAWCATHELSTLKTCLERELARVGVSSAWFMRLYATAPQPAEPPLPRYSTTTTMTWRWTSSGGASTMTCTTY